MMCVMNRQRAERLTWRGSFRSNGLVVVVVVVSCGSSAVTRSNDVRKLVEHVNETSTGIPVLIVRVQ